MERDEATRTGLPLLRPEELDLRAIRARTTDDAGYWTEWLRSGLEAAGLSEGRLAVAGRGPLSELYQACAALAGDGLEIAAGSEVVRLARKAKGGDQLRAIRVAAAGVAAALTRVAELLAGCAIADDGSLVLAGRPLTAGRLRGEIAELLARRGLEQPEGNIVAAGSDAGVPHTVGSDDRVLAAGESLIVDLFPRSELFADCTRTFCVGEPPARLEEAHAAVEAALRLAHARLAVGGRGWDLQLAVCEQFAALGYPTPLDDPNGVRGYVHNLGHGVGYEIHEYPSFAREAGAEGLLEAGDVLTLEPGLYDQEAGYGVRLEDLCVLGPEGPENLTDLPYALDPRTWQVV